MIISYKNKKSEAHILDNTPRSSLRCISGTRGNNKLIVGDNLPILRTLLDTHAGAIDLIYIDPPFATNNDFTITKKRANTVSKSHNGYSAYPDTLVGAEYIEFLRHRLVFLRELLADTGSLYVHIDCKIGHYVKVVLDEIFGVDNFRNDITRIKCNPKNFSRKAYGNTKDIILFYSKSKHFYWNEPRVPFGEGDAKRLFQKINSDGRQYTTIPLHAPGETVKGATGKRWRGVLPPEGRHWRTAPKILDEWNEQGLIEWSSNGVPRKKIFLDERQGRKLQDIWDFKDPQHPRYPTEKNIDMLKLIIEASSQEGDTVLDCFAGSGTTLVAAEMLGRNWIGIDQSHVAISVIQQQLDALHKTLFPSIEYSVLR